VFSVSSPVSSPSSGTGSGKGAGSSTAGKLSSSTMAREWSSPMEKPVTLSR